MVIVVSHWKGRCSHGVVIVIQLSALVFCSFSGQHSCVFAAAAAPHSGSDEGKDPFDTDAAEIRRRSILAYKHGATHKEIDEGKFPTNDQVVQALQLKVAKSVDIARRYRRVLWYSLFVAVYLVVLYLQASAYKSADVVSTLRNALMVDGQLSMTFNNEDEVLAYIGNKILLPTWQDPVCGDGVAPHPAMHVIVMQLTHCPFTAQLHGTEPGLQQTCSTGAFDYV